MKDNIININGLVWVGLHCIENLHAIMEKIVETTESLVRCLVLKKKRKEEKSYKTFIYSLIV